MSVRTCFGGGDDCSGRLSALSRCGLKYELLAWLVGVCIDTPPSSASSLISSSRLEDAEGVAVWSGKEAAKDVSFRPSAFVVSRSVSYGVYFSCTS